LQTSKDSGDRFTVKVAANTLEISPNPELKTAASPLFQNLFSISLFLTLGIEASIWAGYLRWKQTAYREISATLLSVFIVHAFSFAIVWCSFPGFQHFADPFIRYAGLMWLFFSLLYGGILSLYVASAKKLRSTTLVGSISYWLGAVVVSTIAAALNGYGSPLPSASGLSEPIAILLSEIFVVIYEAWIIQRLRRDTLDFKTALRVSLVANIVSCAIGLALAFFVR
jgi:hypothetical protein